MQIVIADAHCTPGAEEEMSKVLTNLSTASRHDDGCLSYHFYADIEDPTHFTSIEQWESADAVTEHMNTPHVAAAFGALEGLLAGKPAITMYEVASSTNLG